MTQLSLPLRFGSEDSPAKMSRWHEWGREMGLEGEALDSFIDSLSLLENGAPELLSSKTFRGYFLPMEDETSKSLYKRWPSSGIVLDGVCLTADTSESPNHVNESTLLDVIRAEQAPQRYYLSPNAAAGMLRRAKQMDRTLFRPLSESLTLLAQQANQPTLLSKESPTASTPAPLDTQEPIGAEPTFPTEMDEYDD